MLAPPRYERHSPGAVLGIDYRAIAAHLVRKAGLTQAWARTGAVTLIQRFGSALNLNIHFHLLVLERCFACASLQTLNSAPFPAPLLRNDVDGRR